MSEPTFNLSDLNGSNGFAINGIAADDFSGQLGQQRRGRQRRWH